MDNITELPKCWYVRVTKENKNVLSKWRFPDSNNYLLEGYITGMYKWKNGKLSKEHDSQVNNEWENEITFEQFERFILNKPKTIQWLWNL